MLTVTIMGMFAAASMAIVGTAVTEEAEEGFSDDPLDDSSATFDIDAGSTGLGLFGLEDQPAPEGDDLLMAAYNISKMGLGEAGHLADFDNRLASDAFTDEGEAQRDGFATGLDFWDDETADFYSSGSDSYAEMLTGGDSSEVLDHGSLIVDMLEESGRLSPDTVRIISDFDEAEDVILYVTEDGTTDSLSVHYVDPENVNTDVQIMDQGIHVMTVMAAGLNFGLRNIIPLHDEAA